MVLIVELPRPMVGLASRTHLRKFQRVCAGVFTGNFEIVRREKKRLRRGSEVRFCKSCENCREHESERRSSCETTLLRYEYSSFSTFLLMLLDDKSSRDILIAPHFSRKIL